MKRVLSIVLACLCALPMTIFVSPGAAAAVAEVSGVVTDTAGAPIPGARVWVSRAGFGSLSPVTSGPDGSYSIANLGDGSWMVNAVAPGFAVRFGNADTEAAGTPVVVASEPITFDISLPRTTASISGTVTGPDGAPIAGAPVRLETFAGGFFVPFIDDFSPYFRYGATGADGTYRFDGLAPTSFRLTAMPFTLDGPPGPNPLVAESWPDDHAPGGGQPIVTAEGASSGPIDVQLDVGGVITGTVTDHTGTPVPGAYVTARSFEGLTATSTQADGTYELIGVPPGDQWVMVQRFVDGSYQRIFNGGAQDPVEAPLLPVTLGSRLEGIDVVFPSLGTVFVSVRDADGRLVPGNTTACVAPGVPQLGPVLIPGYAPSVRCSSGATSPSYMSGGLRLSTGTYNLAAAVSSNLDWSSVTLSSVVTVEVTEVTPMDCELLLAGDSRCVATDPTTLDGDGVAASVEDAAPNGGDGNADGIRDATQSNVTSLPAIIGTGFATIVVPDPLQLAGVTVYAPDSTVFQPEFGRLFLSVIGLAPGGATTLTILRTDAGLADALISYDRASGRPIPRPSTIDGTTISVDLVDGDRFDSPNGPLGSNSDGRYGFSATLGVDDPFPPVITCPSPAPEYLFNSFMPMTVTVSDVGSGLVGPSTITQFPHTGQVGPSSENFVAVDRVGNVTRAACDYTVVPREADLTPPTIGCDRFDLRFPRGSVSQVTAFATDQDGLATPALMSTTVDTSAVGTFSVSFTATDLAGNSASTSCSYTVFEPDTTPPVVRCFDPGPFLVQASPLTVFVVATDETAPAFQIVTRTIDATSEGSFTATFSATDSAGNVGSATCPYSLVADYDGVPATVEDAAPNGGDGNSDGVPDRTQSSVASLPEAGGDGYATISDFMGQWIRSVSTEPLSGTPEPPVGVELVSGIYAVTVDASIASPILRLSNGATFNGLMALTADGWQPATTVINGDAADLDGPNNATVTLRLAAVVSDRTPPTITCPAATSVLLNQPGASLIASVSDDGSGVDYPTVRVALDTKQVGDRSVTVEATDLSGNRASTTCPYRVGVKLVRLIEPTPGELTTVKAGRVAALRWKVVDWAGAPVTDPTHFTSVSVTATSCGRGRHDSIPPGGRTGLRYRGNGVWELGWRAPATKGCYRLTVSVAGDSRSARIRVN